MADKKTFKVGDLVRRINCSFREFSLGEERIVAEVISGHLTDSLKFNGISGSYMPENFELVESCPPTDEELAAQFREARQKALVSFIELKMRGYNLRIGHTPIAYHIGEVTINKTETITKEI